MTRGSLLVELVLALGVAMIALLAIVQIATKSIQSSGFAARSTQANQLAREGMEWIKDQRNSIAWVAFQNKAGATTYCLATLGNWGGGPCGVVTGTFFTRTAVLTVLSASNPKKVSAVVTVTWQESGKSYVTSQTYEFTNFY